MTHIPVTAAHLRLWRDTIRGERTAVAAGETPFLQEPWPGADVSLADRLIASMEAYLIEHDCDWPDDEEGTDGDNEG